MYLSIKKLSLVFVMIFSLSNMNALVFGDDAIYFKAKTIAGKEIQLNQFKNKKQVWLIFWATWCPNCKKEIPELKKLYKKYSDKVEIIAVNIGVSDSEENVRKYIKK